MSEIQILQRQREILEELIKIRQLLERQQVYIPIVPSNTKKNELDCGCPPRTSCMNVACPRAFKVTC